MGRSGPLRSSLAGESPPMWSCSGWGFSCPAYRSRPACGIPLGTPAVTSRAVGSYPLPSSLSGLRKILRSPDKSGRRRTPFHPYLVPRWRDGRYFFCDTIRYRQLSMTVPSILPVPTPSGSGLEASCPARQVTSADPPASALKNRRVEFGLSSPPPAAERRLPDLL